MVDSHSSSISDVSAHSKFHAGELRVQQLAGTRGVAEELSAALSDQLPQIQVFNSLLAKLNTVWISTIVNNQVWVSPIFGHHSVHNDSHSSEKAFTSAVSEKRLLIQLPHPLPENDLLRQSLAKDANSAVGFLAIDLERRRRYRTNGYIKEEKQSVSQFSCLHIDVKEAFPNCPKYIQRRLLVPETENLQPVPVDIEYESDTYLSESDCVLLSNADTLFLGTYNPVTGADVNHRGGNPGFIRIVSSNEIFIPDYRGNGMFQSFGNLQLNSNAGITVLDFNTGYLVQLSGTAKIEWNDANSKYTTESPDDRILHFKIDHITRSKSPVTNYRWKLLDYSPYNPILPDTRTDTEQNKDNLFPVSVQLAKIVEESRSVKTFRFIAPKFISFLPGQYATFEFLDISTESNREASLVRTWTLSEAANSKRGDVNLEVSIKRKPGGLMSNWLHDHAKVGLIAKLLGIGGEMTPFGEKEKSSKLLFISGGIGITPNMAILRGIGARPDEVEQSKLDVVLVHQESHLDDIPFKKELYRRAKVSNGRIKVVVAISRHGDDLQSENHDHVTMISDRITTELLRKHVSNLQDRKVYLCGPIGFMDAIKRMVIELGVAPLNIITEEFNF